MFVQDSASDDARATFRAAVARRVPTGFAAEVAQRDEVLSYMFNQCRGNARGLDHLAKPPPDRDIMNDTEWNAVAAALGKCSCSPRGSLLVTLCCA
jgi:hypothetical protein